MRRGIGNMPGTMTVAHDGDEGIYEVKYGV